MLDNIPYESREVAGLLVEGYSRAGVQSYWRVPAWKIGFDLGALPWAFLFTPTWFISHAHLDHLVALPLLISRRRMMKLGPPAIYLPASVLDDTRRMLRAWRRLDGGRMRCELHGIEAGDEIDLGGNRLITAVPTSHPVPSLGYVVWERRQKLREEYQGLPGERIRELRESGAELTREVRVPLLAYTGDTGPAGLDDNRAFFEAKVLIMELSFLRPAHSREKIHAFGHLHLDDLIERAERFRNEAIVVAHISSRYEADEALRLVEERLPERLRGRVMVWI
jgi:ribonuclease Z